jgi:hypothetical protein
VEVVMDFCFFFVGNEMVDFYAELKSRKKKLFIKKSKIKSHEKVFEKKVSKNNFRYFVFD